MLPIAALASPAGAMRDFRAGKFDAAQKEFERLLEQAKTKDKEAVFDARLHFNAGTAAYRGTNYETAIKHFTAALAAPDLKLQQAAYFNLGNTQFRLGQTNQDFDGIQQQWEAAIKSFQSAVSLDKNDKDAEANLEFAKRAVEWIKGLRLAARRAKELADDATRRREYHQALQIMEDQLKNNPFGKQFEEFTKKLKDIDAIANPDQH
jgi:tetratricopeptide (TPR) repeat protein